MVGSQHYATDNSQWNNRLTKTFIIDFIHNCYPHQTSHLARKETIFIIKNQWVELLIKCKNRFFGTILDCRDKLWITLAERCG